MAWYVYGSGFPPSTVRFLIARDDLPIIPARNRMPPARFWAHAADIFPRDPALEKSDDELHVLACLNGMRSRPDRIAVLVPNPQREAFEQAGDQMPIWWGYTVLCIGDRVFRFQRVAFFVGDIQPVSVCACPEGQIYELKETDVSAYRGDKEEYLM